jgi:TetR/AcrR family tetracycline transcriptional repressor
VLLNARKAGLLDAGADWRDWILVICRELRRSLLGYRDGAKVFSGTRFTDMGHVGAFETYLGALVDGGFPLPNAVQALFTASSFTIGFVIEEQAVYPVPGEKDPHYDEAERAYRLEGEFPLSAAAGQSLFADYDERFETGLRVVIAGIEQVLLPKER